MTMGFKQTIKTSFSTVGTALGTIDSTASLAKNYIDEAIEVQAKTRTARINKAVLEATKELAQDVIALTDEEKQTIALLNQGIEGITG